MSSRKANLHNWLSHPHNQWAFVNTDKIMPTATINRPQASSDLPRQPHDFASFQLDIEGDKLDLTSYLSRSNTDAIMILQHGNVLYEHYPAGNTKHSMHIMMSLTKSVTGLLVGMLQRRGKLSVEDAVTQWVPEVEGTIWRDVTIRQCLDMRTKAKYFDGQHAYRAAAGWNPMLGGEKYGNLKEFLMNFTPQEVVDDRFEYVSPNTDLLGWVIERVTGQSFAEIVEELLWRPMGAESNANVVLDPEGFARAAGGLCATLPDIARIAQLLLHQGENSLGEPLVPAEWIDDIVHCGSKDAWHRGAFAEAFDGFYDSIAYRSCCYADENSETIIGWGVFGQHFTVDRKNQIVLVTTASQGNALGFDKMRMTMGAFKEIQRILTA